MDPDIRPGAWGVLEALVAEIKECAEAEIQDLRVQLYARESECERLKERVEDLEGRVQQLEGRQ